MIPEIIIQTGPPQIPLILESAVKATTLLHPRFDHRFFDNAKVSAFMDQQLPEHRKAFESFRFPIQKYDFFRYLAIYNHGGFYLDLDVFLVRELTPLCASSCVFAFEELTAIQYLSQHLGMDWQIGNYAFGAEAGDRFLGAIIENCLRAQHEPDWAKPMMKGIPAMLQKDYFILNTTGPGLVSRTFAENPQLTDHVTILFPDDVCDRRAWHQFGSFGVHHMAGSWREGQSFLSLRLTRLWDAWTLKRILAEGNRRGKTRLPGGPARSAPAECDLRMPQPEVIE